LFIEILIKLNKSLTLHKPDLPKPDSPKPDLPALPNRRVNHWPLAKPDLPSLTFQPVLKIQYIIECTILFQSIYIVE
jgi:hypothetical protein